MLHNARKGEQSSILVLFPCFRPSKMVNKSKYVRLMEYSLLRTLVRGFKYIFHLEFYDMSKLLESWQLKTSLTAVEMVLVFRCFGDSMIEYKLGLEFKLY